MLFHVHVLFTVFLMLGLQADVILNVFDLPIHFILKDFLGLIILFLLQFFDLILLLHNLIIYLFQAFEFNHFVCLFLSFIEYHLLQFLYPVHQVLARSFILFDLLSLFLDFSGEPIDLLESSLLHRFECRYMPQPALIQFTNCFIFC